MEHEFATVPIRITEPQSSSRYPLNGNFLLINSSSKPYEADYNSQFSIKFVAEGVRHYRLRDRNYKLGQGNYMVVNDGERVRSFSDDPGSSFSIFLTRQLLNEVVSGLGNDLKGFGINEKYVFNEDLSLRTIRFSMQSFLKTSYHQFNRDETEVDPSFYYTAAEHLLKSHFDVNHYVQTIAKIKHATRQEIYRRVHCAIEFLQDRPDWKFTLDEVAMEACMSKYYLIKYFSAIVGETPKEFHTRVRMNLCMAQLRDCNLSMREVAIRCGYPDLFSFSKQFRKWVGCTPSAFRRTSTN